MRRRLLSGMLGTAIVLATTGTAMAQADVAALSLEDLLNTEITSVSRKEQKLSRAAAAASVITSEDIRRSGAVTLADAIRLAPGFSVAQLDASSWAISARGFNGYTANKLLVLIDGRSIYSPDFSGVQWDAQGLSLSEIDRIEVVRGPGGALWGTNAVNGVVNIITKRADETTGGEVAVAAGTLQRGLTEARYSGRVGERGYYRVGGRYSSRGTRTGSDGTAPFDDASLTQAGGRFDWRGEIDTVALTGSIADGESQQVRSGLLLEPPFVTNVRVSGPFTDANILFSWNRSTSSRTDGGIQASYQRYYRRAGDLLERWQVADLDARQRRTLAGRHELVFGAGFRTTTFDLGNSAAVMFNNLQERQNLLTAFLQDEIEIGRNIWITPGSKFEHNERTGFEWQPSIRGTWSPTRGQAVWAALSRAVRTPSKIDHDMRVPLAVLPGPGPLPTVLMVEGDPAYRSEHVDAIEGGYRWQRGIGAVDVAAFVNRYGDLNAPVIGLPYAGLFEQQPVVFIPARFHNGADAQSRGIEVTGTVRPARRMRVVGSYSWLAVDMGPGGSTEHSAIEGPVPNHQFQVRSYVDLPARTEVSALFSAVSAIRPLEIKAYRSLDLRFAWRVLPRIELSVTAQNLFHDNTVEYVNGWPVAVPVRTAAAAGATWRF